MRRRWFGVGLLAGTAASVAILLSPTTPEEETFQGRTLSRWITDLHDPDYRVRRKAEETFQQMGTNAIPALVRALHERDSVLDRVLLTLGKRFPRTGFSTTPAAVLRESAAGMLAALGSDSRPAVPALLEALDDPEERVVREVERALRQHARNELDRLLLALEHKRAGVRAGAVRVTRDVAPRSAQVATRILPLLEDSNAGVREQAALALGVHGRGQAAVVTALAGRLRDREADVRWAAASALERIAPDAEAALPALRAAMQDSSAVVRVQAAKAAWRNGVVPDAFLPVLIAALGETEARWQAAYALGELGPQAAGAVPALIRMLEQEVVPRPLREAPSSAFALGHVGPAAVPALIGTLQHSAPHVRTGAALALGIMGSGAREAVPALTTCLEDRDEEVRQASALSLGRIEPTDQTVVPVLVTMLDADDPYVQSWAADLLKDIAPGAVPYLQPE